MDGDSDFRDSLLREREVLRRQIEDLRSRERYFRQWFEEAPISLWEQDYTEIKRQVDSLREEIGPKHLETYFLAHPERVRELAGLVRVVDVNGFTLRLYKAETKADLLGGITRVFCEESYRSFVGGLLAVAEGETHFHTEKTHVTLEGELLHVQLHWAVAPGYEETYGRVLVSIVDITERKRTEEALTKRSLERRLLLDTIPIQVWYLSDPGTYGALNRAHAAFLGFAPRDLAYGKIETLLGPDLARRLMAGNARVFESGREVHTEEWIPDASGEQRLLAITRIPTLDPRNHVVSAVCTAMDITERRGTEDLLRQSEARFRHIVELSPVGIERYDAEGRLMLINPSCLEIFGIENPDEVRDFRLFEDPNLDDVLKQRIWRGETVRYEVPFDFDKVRRAGLYRTRKEGILFIEVVITPVLQPEQERPGGYLVLVTDLTERIEKDRRIRESEERLRTIMENTGSLIAVLDKGGGYVYANAAHRGLGYLPDDLVGESGFALVHPKDRARLASALRKGDRRGLSRTTQAFRGLARDGRVLHVKGTFDLLRDEAGALRKVVFVGDDITEQRRIQEALAREKERLAMVIEGTRAGTWEWHVQTGETVFNERWAEILGYRLEELAPVSIETWIHLCHPEDLKRSEALLHDHFQGLLPYYTCECRMRHKDGHWVWIEDRGKVVRWSDDGKPLLMTGTHMDVSLRKQAEEEKEAAEARNRQLQKSESLGRMAGAIAHHFNNQLSVVQGNLELAMDGWSGKEKVRAYLSQAMKASRNASEVSALMLTYLGQATGNREPLDLAETCRKVLPMLLASLPPAFTLEPSLPLRGPCVVANANQIQLVLTNLVTNAREAMGETGGAIGLSVTTVDPGEIPTTHLFPVGWTLQAAAYACLAVRDTGCGILEGEMENLFDPFYSTKFTGRGLGLSTALGVVRAHGGAIGVQSLGRGEGPGGEMQQGSLFRVFLPLSGEEVPIRPVRPPELPVVKGGGTVLVIEDEVHLREVAAAMLGRLGLGVVEAGDGVEGVARMKENRGRIRLVLCDLTMPRMGGWETLSALREIEPGIPVILASGYDEASATAGRHAERPNAFLSKPYGLKGLREALGKALGRG